MENVICPAIEIHSNSGTGGLPDEAKLGGKRPGKGSRLLRLDRSETHDYSAIFHGTGGPVSGDEPGKFVGV